MGREPMTCRLLYLVSHPIQYQAPLLRRLAAEPGIVLRVVFENADTVAGYYDEGFRTRVAWDVPLREGYDSVTVGETDLAAEIAAADVVWMHGWQGSMMRGALRRMPAGKPVLMRGESWDGASPDGGGLRGFVKRRFLRWVFSRCAAFLAIGSANRDFYLARGIPAGRIFPVPYAVDNQFFAERVAQADLAQQRKALGLPPDRQVVLFAGKFQPRKRPDLLMEAWSRLPEPRPILLMVGDGEMRSELERKAPPGVIFAGFRNQSELPAIYALADVFVLPSEQEPWGLAVNEAMACGTAVVASDQVGSALDLLDEECGSVFAAGDCGALAAALSRVLADSERRGLAAAQRVSTWDFEADIAGIRQAVAHVR